MRSAGAVQTETAFFGTRPNKQRWQSKPRRRSAARPHANRDAFDRPYHGHQAGIAPKATPTVVPERRVINLMDALKKSIEAETPKKPAAGQAKTRRRATTTGKRA